MKILIYCDNQLHVCKSITLSGIDIENQRRAAYQTCHLAQAVLPFSEACLEFHFALTIKKASLQAELYSEHK